MIIWQEIRQTGIFASQSDIFDKCPVLNEFFKTKPTMIQRLSFIKAKMAKMVLIFEYLQFLFQKVLLKAIIEAKKRLSD